MKTKNSKYSVSKFNDLHFAVSQYGTSMHKEFFDFMVDAGFNKRQIFNKYMKMLYNVSASNFDIIKSVEGGK